MALGATIFKATVQISDMDRGYYGEHLLTIARHPSETDERMMVRLVAFCLQASERLVFAKGLSTDDEPDLWEKDLTGSILRWIDVGLPDERRIRKASGRSNAVVVYAYGVQGAKIWWEQTQNKLTRLRNVTVIRLPAETKELEALAERGMRLNCTVQDGQLWLSDDTRSVEITPEVLQEPASRD